MGRGGGLQQFEIVFQLFPIIYLVYSDGGGLHQFISFITCFTYPIIYWHVVHAERKQLSEGMNCSIDFD